MQVFHSLAAWKALRLSWQGTVGLVPTMGALHEGHLSLIRRSRAENALTVLWVFVNPKQFGDQVDFADYPRVLETDQRLAEECGVDYLLAPGMEEVYPPGFQTHVEVEELSLPLEGKHRPGHFKGVCTVVTKMLCLTQPTRAYFGQKDAQQCAVVRRMVRDLDMLSEIVICPTARGADGLALSSRNVHLNPQERQSAGVLYRALQAAQEAVREGERDCAVLRERICAELSGEPRAEVDYVSIADPDSLAECTTLIGRALASLAVWIGATRLIDNLLLEPEQVDTGRRLQERDSGQPPPQ